MTVEQTVFKCVRIIEHYADSAELLNEQLRKRGVQGQKGMGAYGVRELYVSPITKETISTELTKDIIYPSSQRWNFYSMGLTPIINLDINMVVKLCTSMRLNEDKQKQIIGLDVNCAYLLYDIYGSSFTRVA